jgi:hypothetical protein
MFFSKNLRAIGLTLRGRPTSIILGAACRSPPMNLNAPIT